MFELISISFLLLLALIPGTVFSTTSFSLETGQTTNAYNKVKVDSENGSIFNLEPALDSTFYYRLSLIKTFKSPHGIRFVYAPLSFTGEKNYSEDINFNGVTFQAGEITKTEYQFNSYRGTYFYEFFTNKNILLRLGGTLKVRDALIELKQNERKKFKKNVGIVPLLYLFSEYKWDSGFRAALDFDGLMAPQGRALDIALMGGYYFSPAYHLNIGYRMLEGGVDNEKVYNFSQINYYFTALQVNF